jgi:hypothetical protein
MYNETIKSAITVHLSNVFGWRTKRKIVVIESDDWGSIRMDSKDSYQRLLKSGIPIENDHYNLYDSLESNQDLEHLFETLQCFKDLSGRHPVMTGANIVANPDFEKIKKNGFTDYEYEPFTETLKRYPDHDRVFNLWKEGIDKRLFVPIFHGREHLNVQRWMHALQNGNRSTLLAFENNVTGIPLRGINNEIVPNFQAAFDIDTVNDVQYLKNVLETGLNLFEDLYGYRSKYFVPTNGPFNNSLEITLHELGITYINTGKRQIEPLGNGKYKTNIRFLGKKNQYNQLYLTRNCFFEPSSLEYSSSRDWVDTCLKEIEIAFRWNKPATISTHRVNYIGFLNPKNRERSLRKLEELLKRMLNRWPDIEFMTSVELGALIAKEKS